MKKTSVLIAFDSMKTENSGYFYFGTGLGEALIKENSNRFKLSFYLHKSTWYKFKQVAIIKLYKFHKVFFSVLEQIRCSPFL